MNDKELARSMPGFIKLWFLLDFILCCTPPIYLAFSGRGATPGLPFSIIYFVFCGAFVTLSILAAERVKA
ncbi:MULTISPECIES: hypothetical protein [Acidiphilium]|uniref:hypothetical protein n=1 Tax=Acidiphilium TaxID=522 RepID=UPI00006BDDFE|nr:MULTISPECIES: hypothetical protein [Acidiphilium]UNC16411.1 hypothetical protein FE249_19610 [Acidiphilium multivorum]